ncbi:hydrolase [Fredinandcohnia sp. 179-A 10B2 NHS]|uniref:hydrolase n=1 Tax=Fredinandcohnia sp. 179-A 10B2 NHS TaxID=3235176 RepID=UPI00399F2106
MEQQPKKTYYVSVEGGEISQVKSASSWEYKIEATDDEIIRLRELFDENYANDVEGFLRAHVPFVEYHNDSSNDKYDENMLKVFKMIYELGDEEAREFIKTQGIISSLGYID